MDPSDLGGGNPTGWFTAGGIGLAWGLTWLRKFYFSTTASVMNDRVEKDMLERLTEENKDLRTTLETVAKEHNEMYRTVGELTGTMKAMKSQLDLLTRPMIRAPWCRPPWPDCTRSIARATPTRSARWCWAASCRRTSSRQISLLRLLTYASHTKTWGMLPPVGQVQGIHVVIGDWNTRKAGRVFKPAAVLGRELLSRPDVVALLDQLIAAHTAKHPAEGPIRAR